MNLYFFFFFFFFFFTQDIAVKILVNGIKVCFIIPKYLK